MIDFYVRETVWYRRLWQYLTVVLPARFRVWRSRRRGFVPDFDDVVIGLDPYARMVSPRDRLTFYRREYFQVYWPPRPETPLSEEDYKTIDWLRNLPFFGDKR